MQLLRVSARVGLPTALAPTRASQIRFDAPVGATDAAKRQSCLPASVAITECTKRNRGCIASSTPTDPFPAKARIKLLPAAVWIGSERALGKAGSTAETTLDFSRGLNLPPGAGAAKGPCCRGRPHEVLGHSRPPPALPFGVRILRRRAAIILGAGVGISLKAAPMNDVTQILSRIEDGDGKAAEELLPLVYEELRKLAAQKMAQEKPGQTLQATALVHEAYIRLVDVDKTQHWQSRGHFFATAAEAMRRILVEHARRKRRTKRGSGMRCGTLDDVEVECESTRIDVLAVDEALGRLDQEDPLIAQVVKLRFFGGLSHEEAACVLGVSGVTVRRYWRYARAWLHREMDVE